MNLPAKKSHFMNTTRRMDELAKINEQARDDNGPGAEHVVELQEVEDLHHAQEEGPGQHLVPVQKNIIRCVCVCVKEVDILKHRPVIVFLGALGHYHL